MASVPLPMQQNGPVYFPFARKRCGRGDFLLSLVNLQPKLSDANEFFMLRYVNEAVICVALAP